MEPRKIIVLGATGSIGSQTLDCVEEANHKEPGSFIVTGLSANTNLGALLDSAARFPKAMLALQSTQETHRGIHFMGIEAVSKLVETAEAELVVNGISGSAGLMASVHALSSGKNLALANKESVVMGYSHLKALADKHKLSIIPVDSEHAALFQLISRIGADSISELTITASGGPFRLKSWQELENIKPDEAARHPVWNMGRKISIDSATLANKGLELIEAVRLFGVPESRVKVLIHPESLVHALVRTVDGALYAHMSSPDMRLPINIALHWPLEVPTLYGRLDLAGKTLHFDEPDTDRFPMLDLARRAARSGEAATIAYNAANEIAVEAFDSGAIRFTAIGSVVAAVLDGDWTFPVPDLGSIFDIDAKARSMAHLAVTEFSC
ncbi:MAG TPA: 1-deoxy-D-xylulose-5-phosphate reductoisomerase [Rectinemataceae bacterium]|nr:1-deoxy-D-xylulose-5-phosphate reductoisomerase [Rectinemataceae bacterium]